MLVHSSCLARFVPMSPRHVKLEILKASGSRKTIGFSKRALKGLPVRTSFLIGRVKGISSWSKFGNEPRVREGVGLALPTRECSSRWLVLL